jgi:hypothetical protein
MDVLIQGVGWLLLSASIGVTALIFFRQQAAAIEERRSQSEQREKEERRAAERSARERFATAVEAQLARVHELINEIEKVLEEIGPDKSESGEPISEQLELRTRFYTAMWKFSDAMLALLAAGVASAYDAKFRDGPFAQLTAALTEWRDGVEAAWQSERLPLPRAWVGQIGKHTNAVIWAILGFRRSLTDWLMDGSVRNVPPVPEDAKFKVAPGQSGSE